MNSTPTLLVGGRLYRGGFDSDAIIKLVDSLAATPDPMIHRMTAALLSLAGLFISAYLYLYKIGRIGTLACGTGGCETVQLSPWSRFAGLEVSLIGVLGYAGLLAAEPCLAAARSRRPALALDAAGRAGWSWVQRVSDLPGAVRHSRHLPVVCGVGCRHPGLLSRLSSIYAGYAARNS